MAQLSVDHEDICKIQFPTLFDKTYEAEATILFSNPTYTVLNLSYHLKFFGPIIFCNEVGDNRQKFQIPLFAGHFIIVKSKETHEFSLLPTIPYIDSEISIIFSSSKYCDEFYTRFCQIRKIIEKSNIDFPSFSIPIKDNLNIVNQLDGIFSLDQISIDSQTTLPCDQIEGVTTDFQSSLRDQDFPLCVIIITNTNQVHNIFIRNEPDLCLAILLINNIIIKRRQNIKHEQIYETAQILENNFIDMSFPQDSNAFISEMKNPYITSTNSFVSPTFKKVEVPKQAGDSRELISFGLPIKRKIYLSYATHKHKKPSLMRELRPQFVAGKTKNVMKKIPQIMSFPNLDNIPLNRYTKLFRIVEQSTLEFIRNNSSPISVIRSLNETSQKFKIPPDMESIFTKLKFPLPQDNIEKAPGFFVIEKIKKIDSDLPKTAKLSETSCVEFLGIISSVLVDFPKPNIDLKKSLMEILLSDTKLASIIPKYNVSNTNQFAAIISARLLMIHKLSYLFKKLANNSNWRDSNFMVGSLMLSSTFICDIALSISDIEQHHFTGPLPDMIQFTKPQPIETYDGRISLIARGITQMHMYSDSLNNFDLAYGLLVHFICEFFTQGFKMPAKVAIKALRSPWYVFASSLEMQACQDMQQTHRNEIMNLVAIIKQVSMRGDFIPHLLMRLFFLLGLTNGVAWQFVLFGAARGMTANLYQSDAPASNPARVSSIALSIALLRTINVKLTDDNVLKYADLYKDLQCLY